MKWSEVQIRPNSSKILPVNCYAALVLICNHIPDEIILCMNLQGHTDTELLLIIYLLLGDYRTSAIVICTLKTVK